MPCLPRQTVIERITERWRTGGPSSRIADAGVLLHQFDLISDPDPTREPWIPGRGGGLGTRDRMSSAFIYQSMRADPSGNIPIYSFSLGGLVLRPEHVRLNCAFPFDVGSFGRQCYNGAIGCIPGCSENGVTEWCARDLAPELAGIPCAYAPRDLDVAMAGRDRLASAQQKPVHDHWDDGKFYDEIVVNATHFVHRVPHAIEAVFYIVGQNGADCWNPLDGKKCDGYV